MAQVDTARLLEIAAEQLMEDIQLGARTDKAYLLQMGKQGMDFQRFYDFYHAKGYGVWSVKKNCAYCKHIRAGDLVLFSAGGTGNIVGCARVAVAPKNIIAGEILARHVWNASADTCGSTKDAGQWNQWMALVNVKMFNQPLCKYGYLESRGIRCYNENGRYVGPRGTFTPINETKEILDAYYSPVVDENMIAGTYTTKQQQWSKWCHDFTAKFYNNSSPTSSVSSYDSEYVAPTMTSYSSNL